MRTYNVIKTWVTDAGYVAAIIKHGTLGHLCGYVGINRNHPLYEVGYSEKTDVLTSAAMKVTEEKVGKRGPISVLIAVMEADEEGNFMPKPDVVFDVHGSLTYSGGDPDYPVNTGQYIWWFGFDCAHYGDTPAECNEEYVTKECEWLGQQLKEVEHEHRLLQ